MDYFCFQYQKFYSGLFLSIDLAHIYSPYFIEWPHHTIQTLNSDKVFILCAEMRQQDTYYGIHLFEMFCIFAGVLPQTKPADAIQSLPRSWSCITKQICFLRRTAWVVVLWKTNASKAFFHHEVTPVHHMLFCPLMLRVHMKLDL